MVALGCVACSSTSTAPTAASASSATSAFTSAEPAAPSSNSSGPMPAVSLSQSAPVTTASTVATTAPPAPPTTDAAPGFTSASAPVTAADLGASWRPGCPVGPSGLRRLTVTFHGFDGTAHTGELVVATGAVRALSRVFGSLWASGVQVRSIRPVSEFGGSDDSSMAADNTSAFNCREAVRSDNVHTWSQHAYGVAIDVNPRENPYVEGGRVLPPEGRAYTNRSAVAGQPGVATAGGPLVGAFASVGWGWGGRWSSPDYQHFSSTGR